MLDEGTETDFVIWLQGLAGWLEPVMKLFTQLGYSPVITLAVGAIFWCIDSRLGQRMAVFFFLASAVTGVLKRTFHAPRPFWLTSEVRAFGVGSASFGMPSGHAVGASVWLLVAATVRRRWAWLAAIGVAIMIGVSRIYLGAHFPSQVVVGWLVGVVVLFAFIQLEPRFLTWFAARSLQQQLGVVIGASAVLYTGGALSAVLLNDWSVPSLWEQNAAGRLEWADELDPVDAAGVGAPVGAFAGTGVGGVLMAHAGGFHAAGSLAKRFLRLPVGIACVAVVLALSVPISALPGLHDRSQPVGLVWEFVWPFATLFTIFYLAPLVFRRLRLSDVARSRSPRSATAAEDPHPGRSRLS
ncbi:MAG: phosphatase PAP2 family protein [Thermoleophilia bacterium]|nr:phosphatase PAP2 family protein [Thermoleophilia bacterium]